MKNKEAIQKSPIYLAIYETMLTYQYAYLGGLAFKGYIRKKRPSEDSALWNDLVKNTVAQPICRYIVDSINDVLFEPGIKRTMQFCTPTGEYIDPKNTEWSDLMLLDADLDNRDMTGFMETVSDMASIFGQCWVFVDMPTAYDNTAGNARPYCCVFSPLDVWDWCWEFYNGKAMLEYIKVKTGEDQENYYITCYHLGDAVSPSYWNSWEVPKNAVGVSLETDATLVAEGVFPLGMALPGFIAYGRRDPRTRDVGVSDIDSATDAMREHYKLECEAYSSIQFAKTIIRADPGVSVPVHAGAIVRATMGQIEAIPVDTNDVDKIIAKQNNILSDIEGLTGLGGLRNSRNQVQSGVSIIEERKTLHRVAKAKARLMEVVEENIWTFAARFMGVRWAGDVNFNTDYEAFDTNYRMALMTQAKLLAPGNAIVEAMVAKEVIAMLAPDQDTAEFTQAYIKTIADPSVKLLMEDEEYEIFSRDLEPSQIPTDAEKESADEEDDGVADSGIEDTAIGGPGTPVTYMGQSYTPQNAIAAQLNYNNVGR